MAFTLKKVIDGESKTFTLQDILELLGDPTNDEIFFDGEAFRISSFLISSGTTSGGVGGSGSSQGTTFTWQQYLLEVTVAGQTEFQLPEVVPPSANLLFTVNGVYYETGPGESYYIQDDKLYWQGSFELDQTDTLRLRYQITT
jgi:hypothetical protein